jgi:biopolymer transport protein TolR
MRTALGGQGRAATAIRSEINVTPLVDVCLVLLIIFIVVAPQLRKGIDIALPETARPKILLPACDPITVAITRDGSVFVDHTKVSRERLAATLKALHGQAGAVPVVVDGDRLLPYQEVVSVLDAVRGSGFERVGLATRKNTLD